MFEFTDAHSARYLHKKQHSGSLFNETQLSILVERVTSSVSTLVDAFWGSSLDRALTIFSILRRVNLCTGESEEAENQYVGVLKKLTDLNNPSKILLAGLQIQPLFDCCRGRFQKLKLERIGPPLTDAHKVEIHSIVEEHLDLAIVALTTENQKRTTRSLESQSVARRSTKRRGSWGSFSKQAGHVEGTRKRVSREKGNAQTMMFYVDRRQPGPGEDGSSDSASAKRPRLRSSAR